MRDCPKGAGAGKDTKGGKGTSPLWRTPGKGNGGVGNPADPTGGNPKAIAICKHFAKSGTCQYAPRCRFKHVYGATGALSHIAEVAMRAGPECVIPVEAFPEENLAWNNDTQAYDVDPDKEVDLACNAAVMCGLCSDGDEAAALKDWILGEEAPSFQRPR